MRIISPTGSAFGPNGASTSGTVVWSTKINATATVDVTVGPTTIYTPASDSLFALYALVETYNAVAMVTGDLDVVVSFTGENAYPWDSLNVGLTAGNQTSAAVTRRALAGTNITLTYDIAGFSGTSCDYTIDLVLVLLA